MPIDDDENDLDDDNESAKRQVMKLSALHQILYYQIHNGRQMTPLHLMTGHYIYDKTKSRSVITQINRIGACVSYNTVRKYREQLANYTVKAGSSNVPIPSHFNTDDFTSAAFDNFDFNDRSSLSGTKSTHDTVTVLFQEISPNNLSSRKPALSEIGINRRPLKGLLPCQMITNHTKKPSPLLALCDDYHVAEDLGLSTRTSLSEFQRARKVEFIIDAFLFKTSKSDDNLLPTWAGVHTNICNNTVPLKRLGFLPVLPGPVTEYSIVVKELENLKNVCEQLTQSVLPVVCDEGVFSTVADIMIRDPSRFPSLYPMLGMFHLVKVALRCAGRYITGSGFDDSLIEAGVFGPNTAKTVLEGSHYVRSLHGMLVLQQCISMLRWEAFLVTAEHKHLWAAFMKSLDLSGNLSNELLTSAAEIKMMMDKFTAECSTKSQLCTYLSNFEKIVELIKLAIVSDREGNWPLHVQVVGELLPIFREFDCVHYTRYASYYYEQIIKLEEEQPELYRRFVQGHFAVRTTLGKFNAVAPDLRLEQSIQRAKKSASGVIGQTRKTNYVTVWELIYHEVLAISNAFEMLIDANVMSHSDTNITHHSMRGKSDRNQFSTNIYSLLRYVRDKGNPWLISPVTPLGLHNISTKQLVHPDVGKRLLNLLENGREAYNTFQQQRFASRSVKMGETIHQRRLPDFNHVPGDSTRSNAIDKKDIALAQKKLDMVRERGVSLEEGLTYDIMDYSMLFEGAHCKKPDKYKLTRELEQAFGNTVEELPVESGRKTCKIVDFMSVARMISTGGIKTFGEFIDILMKGVGITDVGEVHFVFDSYLDSSLKAAERLRRTEETAIDVVALEDDTKLPVQMAKFWASSANKLKLQLLAIEKVKSLASKTSVKLCTSGLFVVNDEYRPSELHLLDRVSPVEYLDSLIEEADERLILHIMYAVNNGHNFIIVRSTDTDVVCLLMRYVGVFKSKGLRELWIKYGSGCHVRYIPIHYYHEQLGPQSSSDLIKIHILTGNDLISKLGTKHSAFKQLTESPPELSGFAESDELPDEDVRNIESILCRVWAPSSGSTTFNSLRYQFYRKSNSCVQNLPPTSDVVRGHILRSFFVIRRQVNLLNPNYKPLQPENYGWKNTEQSILLPEKFLNPIPDQLIVTCGCKSETPCKRNQCSCRRANVKCTTYCLLKECCNN